MQKSKVYENVRFDPQAILDVQASFEQELDRNTNETIAKDLTVDLEGESWSHDSDDEFFSDIRRGAKVFRFHEHRVGATISIRFNRNYSDVSVSLPSRRKIESVFETLEHHTERCRMPAAEQPEHPTLEKPTIFIGHGQSNQWRDLKDHLHDKHNIPVEAYEIGSREGHAIRDILEEMLDSSSMAFLLMTGEDTMGDGTVRARQNVVHEVGLFQGRLGFPRAIVLLEEGTEEFSNLHGIQQIRFSKGRIRETFGDVLAVIRREFHESND